MRDWHTNVAKALLENWQVAEEIVDAVGNHEDLNREARGPVTLTDVVALATLLQQHIANGALSDPTEPLVWALKRLQVQLRGLPERASTNRPRTSQRSRPC